MAACAHASQQRACDCQRGLCLSGKKRRTCAGLLANPGKTPESWQSLSALKTSAQWRARTQNRQPWSLTQSVSSALRSSQAWNIKKGFGAPVIKLFDWTWPECNHMKEMGTQGFEP